MTHLPKFSPSLLHPRYWLTWCGIGLLWLVVQLPYPVLYRLGCGMGRLAMRLMKRRVRIAHRNLELCFPQMPEQERQEMVKKNFESVGMGLMETGMAWFWPDSRINRWVDVTGMDNTKMHFAEGKGILLIGVHFLTLELGARVFGMHIPGIGVYRPNDNPLLDWLQTWGRLRSNKTMIDRKDLKGMVRALKSGDVVWYAPDHDYGPRSSVFVPFFAVEQTATTTGTWMLAKMSKACLVPFVPRRKPDGKGYELIMLEGETTPPLETAEETAAWMNKVVERCILMAPEQYMWLHRRFKTRPDGVPSRY
ncbi:MULTISPECIES: Kdo(2)-lipid IV(A) acyltransferase [Enterobacteriaceae]|jgi:KDO2-lipid IV(A) lauroyltransferase|uniref:Lipid A biosynthesis acyltransferase n=1 Tax=Citrobacter bitternis TaxID=1585982 RepID=A0ABW1Q0J2_9ENTR|nr:MULTISPECIES: Kdo(2)-lipid IV(A) acyltransferase [Enterobacteriaceae]AUU91657.1 lipid A biosynthesis lauroyl acyltransferase [Enterobacteriaceae bacterium ENNIH3]AUV08325.1 lipid A biosynthesis lauroyl acyltransferase [Enterobacteriaceae bacterium ENNIH2]MBS6737017.1 LpxL/LpxP family Kdo(2)-lipid IV(A) lauroyl/palmitoleoyl acyltransferasee [Enterobacteriaceae bacterium]PTA96878.1 lipid A biosynthesis lauroyl acyltransferase [Kluyvera sp. Nf5]PWF49938.1 lipid A biosynthesis lauroyl acyltrans